MANWKEYTTKTIPEDTDEIVIADAKANANKRTPLSGLWNWIAGKLATAVISQLETQNKSIIPALNELNSKPGKNIISIAGCTAAKTSLMYYLKGKVAKVTFFAFYSLTDNPFSFNQGFCIAFNSSGIMQDDLFVLVGISRDGNKIETKQVTIK